MPNLPLSLEEGGPNKPTEAQKMQIRKALGIAETPLYNFEATTAPTVLDGSTAGYSVGSLWIDTVGLESYRCVNATPGAAVWVASAVDASEISSLIDAAVAAHGGETDNPHNVTASQTGAATTSDLSAHAADTENPHAVTAAQAGAAPVAHVTDATNPHAVTAAQVGAIGIDSTIYSRVDIVGLTGGAATDLDGLSTSGFTGGQLIRIYSGAVYRLVGSVDASDGLNVITPTDDANKRWFLEPTVAQGSLDSVGVLPSGAFLAAPAGSSNRVTLSQNSTLVLGVSSSGHNHWITRLEVTQDNPGGRTVAWPGSVTWASGAPTQDTGVGAVGFYSFETFDAGVSYVGFSKTVSAAATIPAATTEIAGSVELAEPAEADAGWRHTGDQVVRVANFSILREGGGVILKASSDPTGGGANTGVNTCIVGSGMSNNSGDDSLLCGLNGFSNSGRYCLISGREASNNVMDHARVHGGGTLARLIDVLTKTSTADATATVLSVGGALYDRAERGIVVPIDTAWLFTARIVAKRADSASMMVFTRRGAILNDNNTCGISSIDAIGTDHDVGGLGLSTPPSVAVGAYNDIKITVYGAAATSIDWTCQLNLTQVG